jgi:hypothetical protein
MGGNVDHGSSIEHLEKIRGKSAEKEGKRKESFQMKTYTDRCQRSRAFYHVIPMIYHRYRNMDRYN